MSAPAAAHWFAALKGKVEQGHVRCIQNGTQWVIDVNAMQGERWDAPSWAMNESAVVYVARSTFVKDIVAFGSSPAAAIMEFERRIVEG